jgi:hypothetical protein
MTKKQAKETLYNYWENGKIPANFTEDHSEYQRAVNQLVELGYLIFSDFF